VTFPETSEGVFTIDHTYVSETMRGSGLAAKLVQAAVDQIHEQGGRVAATCPYAKQWMEKNKVYR
ncbi:MAG: GNAT family N-acetyltransferase, partial [Eubacteriales bacterium]|nr:GNAT family N-acetyltransferase [Eubacteriales bacterium]